MTCQPNERFASTASATGQPCAEGPRRWHVGLGQTSSPHGQLKLGGAAKPCNRRASGPFLPSAVGRLLPIGDGAAGGLRARPLLACASDRGGIAALEQIDDPSIRSEIGGFGAVD